MLIDFTAKKGKRVKGNYESKGRVSTSELLFCFVYFVVIFLASESNVPKIFILDISCFRKKFI